MMRQLLAGLMMLLCAIQIAYAALDINTATADEFDKLKGIGPVKARAIVDFRIKNGPFRSIEDLKNVPGIGDSTFEAIRHEISIGAGSGLRATKSPGSARDSMRQPEKGSAVGVPSMNKGDDRAIKSEARGAVGSEAAAATKKDAPKSDAGKAKLEVKTGERPTERK